MDAFVVATAHQLLNALEARRHFRSTHAIAIITLSQHYGRDVYDPLLAEADWEKVIYLPPISSPSAFERLLFKAGVNGVLTRQLSIWKRFQLRNRYDRLARRIGALDRLFVGNYWDSAYMRHLTNQAAWRELILLDDGTDTLLLNRQRREGIPYSIVEESLRGWRRLRHRVAERLVHWNRNQAPNVTFFTTYGLDPKPGDQVVKNEYLYLRQKISGQSPLEVVYFLGQPLVETDHMTLDAYLAGLESVKRVLSEESVIYVPHRREDSQKVNRVAERVQWPVQRFTMPIEFEISVRGNRPRMLASFLCSALETCRNIFGDRIHIKVFHLGRDQFTRSPEALEYIYSSFKKNQSPTFEVLEL